MNLTADGIFQKEKEAIEKLEQVNKSSPIPRPAKDHDELLYEWNKKVETKNGNKPFKKMVITGVRHFSKKQLSHLYPITLSQMRVPMIHHNSYLLCKTLTSPYPDLKEVGVSILIQDPNGDVEELFIYTLLSKIEKLFLPNSIIVIKEPFLQYYDQQAAKTIIRVDSPSDIVQVDECDQEFLSRSNALNWYIPLTMSFEECKTQANLMFKNGNYEEALRFYDRALRLEPNSAVIYLNKSLVLIGLERYYEAYEEAKKAGENGGDEEKTLFRLGKAAYGLRDWPLAFDHFSKLIQLYPKNSAAAKELQRTKLRISETQTGRYDLKKLYNDAYKKNLCYLDAADYHGPVEVADIPNKGKGLIATKDILKGTLLMVSKAFSLAYENDKNKNCLVPYNILSNEMDTSVEALNILAACEEVKKNPHKTKDLYALFAGDLKRDDETDDGIVDIGRIEQICTFNSFMPGNMFENMNTGIFAAGLWILPSYINHSCLANASRVFYGDIMMAYAISDLKQGDEIMWNYVDLNCPFKKRTERLQRYRFACTCQLCVLDRTDPKYDEREDLLQKIPSVKQKIIENPKVALPDVLSLVNQVKASYKHRTKLQVRLLQVTGLLAGCYQAIGQLEKSLLVQEESIKILDDGGLKYQYYSPYLLMQLGKCYEIMFNVDMAKVCMMKAFERIKIRTGIDLDLFSHIYPDVCNIMDF